MSKLQTGHAEFVAYATADVASMRDELLRLKTVNEGLMTTMIRFANCNLNDGNCASVEVAARRIRNTARLAINKAEDRK